MERIESGATSAETKATKNVADNKSTSVEVLLLTLLRRYDERRVLLRWPIAMASRGLENASNVENSKSNYCV